MKTIASRTAAGCLVWLLICGVISTCLLPVATFAASLSSTIAADFVVQSIGPYLCPANSTPELVTSPTIMRSKGRDVPATSFGMQCVDANGTVVREPSPDYAFYWIGLLMVGSLVVSGVLALLFTAPVSALIARFLNRLRTAPKV